MQGTLPPALPPNVLYYNASENYLNGTLPASWADANSSISLQYLDLNNNTLQARAAPVHASFAMRGYWGWPALCCWATPCLPIVHG